MCYAVLCCAQAQKLQSDNDMLLRQVEIFTLEKAEMLGQIQVGQTCSWASFVCSCAG
jgi:hypothetical protein